MRQIRQHSALQIPCTHAAALSAANTMHKCGRGMNARPFRQQQRCIGGTVRVHQFPKHSPIYHAKNSGSIQRCKYHAKNSGNIQRCKYRARGSLLRPYSMRTEGYQNAPELARAQARSVPTTTVPLAKVHKVAPGVSRPRMETRGPVNNVKTSEARP